MVAFILWILMGALVGWIASLIMKTDAEQGAILNIAVGVVGAMIGGFLMRVIGRSGANTNETISLYSVLVSVLGASVLLGIVNLFRRGALRGP